MAVGSAHKNPIKKYYNLLQSFALFSEQQIAAFFKFSDLVFLKFFLNLTYNTVVSLSVPITDNTCRELLKKKFGKQLLKLVSVDTTLEKKRKIYMQNPLLVQKLAYCVVTYAEA